MMAKLEWLPEHLIQMIAARSEAVVVMTHLAAKLLEEVYGVSGPKVHIIPHGVPDIPIDVEGDAKSRLELAGQQVICSFGLINRGKGLVMTGYSHQNNPTSAAGTSTASCSLVGGFSTRRRAKSESTMAVPMLASLWQLANCRICSAICSRLDRLAACAMLTETR
jgi:hypothetical protein